MEDRRHGTQRSAGCSERAGGRGMSNSGQLPVRALVRAAGAWRTWEAVPACVEASQAIAPRAIVAAAAAAAADDAVVAAASPRTQPGALVPYAQERSG